ncbi:MAG: hypothetical protein WDN04_15100 [Rhodospirillales bacterium]
MSGSEARGQREEGPPIGEFLAHLRARRRGALGIFAATVATGLVIAALLPPRFRATATLAVLPAPEFTVRQEAGSRAFNSSALALDQIMKAETVILESDELHAGTMGALGVASIYPSLDPESAQPAPLRLLADAAHFLLAPWRVTPLDPQAALQDRALDWFADDLTVLPAKESNIITVTFGHRSGAVAAQVLNTMMARYAQRRGHVYDDPQLTAVRGETDALGVAVREADAELAGYKKAHAISDSAAERALLLQRQSDAAQSLADALAASAEQHARLATLEQQIRGIPPSVPLYREQDHDTRLAAIDASLLALHENIGIARTNYRDTSRKVTDLVTQLEVREAERASVATPKNPSVVRDGRSLAIDPLLVDRAHAATEEAAAVARVRALHTELSDIAASLGRLEATETSLTNLMRRKNVADANFAAASRVLAEQRLTEAEDALRMANVRVIQPARAPQRPTATRKLICLASVLLGGLVAGIWFLLGYVVRPTFLTADGLAYATGMPVLGMFSSSARRTGGGAFTT